ncbi:MAG: sigma-70 family RNA polymerase sigma factor [Phycisphaerae bacterium]|nr:sigma-70 family RNA polymerase sigma factor [Phycisphaerae bacterium]
MELKRDEELLAEHLAGKVGVFDTLVARYMDGLYGFFKRFVGNATAADDLVQETLLQVHLAAGSFDPSRSFKPWLYTIAANKGRDYMRARGRRPMQSLDSAGGDSDGPSPAAQLEGDATTATEQLDSREQTELVRRMIAQMPEHLRLILILGYYQKLPYAEIAEILGIPVGTVKSRLHSAVNHFSRLWLAHTNASTSE